MWWGYEANSLRDVINRSVGVEHSLKNSEMLMLGTSSQEGVGGYISFKFWQESSDLIIEGVRYRIEIDLGLGCF